MVFNFFILLNNLWLLPRSDFSEGRMTMIFSSLVQWTLSKRVILLIGPLLVISDLDALLMMLDLDFFANLFDLVLEDALNFPGE